MAAVAGLRLPDRRITFNWGADLRPCHLFRALAKPQPPLEYHTKNPQALDQQHQVIHCYGMGIATRVLRKADAMQFESYIENLAACQTVETLKMKEAVVRESVLPSS